MFKILITSKPNMGSASHPSDSDSPPGFSYRMGKMLLYWATELFRELGDGDVCVDFALFNSESLNTPDVDIRVEVPRRYEARMEKLRAHITTHIIEWRERNGDDNSNVIVGVEVVVQDKCGATISRIGKVTKW